MQIRKLNSWTLSLGLVAALALLVVAASFAQPQPVFRIGVLDDERGPISRGAQLAVKKINDSGGVRGADGTMFRLELVVQSTGGGSQLAQAVAAIQQASVIAILGPATTEEVLSGLAILQTANVPVLTPAIGDTVVASDASGNLFRTRAAEVLMGRALANYLVDDLRLQQIVTVQMDLQSTAGVVGFTTALASRGVPAQSSILFESGMDVGQLANTVITANPQIAVAYGPTGLAAELYTTLRQSGWRGLYAYNQAERAEFRDAIPLNQLEGILGVTTWPLAAHDPAGTLFMNEFAWAFGETPGPIEAASYDAVTLLAAAIGLPGDLRSTLPQLNNVQGVQGLLSPAQLSRGETSNSVAIIQLGPLGGPQVNARYAGNQRIPDVGITIPTAQPSPTATPEGVVLTIKSAVQNVRTGPGLQYDILGQLRQGQQARVIGATRDFTWVVIEFRGQNGWLATSLLDIFGDLSTLPIIQPPPAPTPGPPTATPSPQPFADIVVLGASPAVMTRGQQFNLVVTVQNRGSSNAGQFGVAASFPPDNVYSGVTLNQGLGAGQTTTLTLSGTLNGTTGIYSAIIVADLNQEINEGPDGEANNDDFIIVYRLDRAVLNSGTLTLNPGGTLSLEGAGAADVQWNATGTSLDFPSPPGGSGMYIITGVATLNDVYFALINPSLANTFNLNVALLPNAFIGIVTAEGNRGVMHVDSVVSGGPISLSYRVYQP